MILIQDIDQSSCRVALEVDQPRILILAKSGFGNWIHLPLSLHKLCAWTFCKSVLSCRLKMNEVFDTTPSPFTT